MQKLPRRLVETLSWKAAEKKMTDRIKFDERGEAILPRDMLEDGFLEEDVLLKAHPDEKGNVVLTRLPTYEPRRYSEEDLAEFAAEDRMPPRLRERLLAALRREPRLFRR